MPLQNLLVPASRWQRDVASSSFRFTSRLGPASRWLRAARVRLALTAVLVPFVPTGFALGDSTSDAALLWSDSLKAETNGDYQGAIVKMDQLMNVFPDPYLVHVRKGWLFYMNHNYSQAANDYHEAATTAPNAITPYIGLVYTYRAAGLTQNTEEACNQVLKRDPENTTALKMLAAISYEQASYAESAHYYQILVDAHPEEPAYLSGAGWSYLKLSKNEMAVQFFRRLLILSPDYAYARQGYASAQHDTGTR